MKQTLMKWGTGLRSGAPPGRAGLCPRTPALCVALACACAPALARAQDAPKPPTPAIASPPAPPEPAKPAAPAAAPAPTPPEPPKPAAPAVAPPPAPPAQPDWTPPGDSAQGGEGNLHDAPLFEPTGERRRFTFTYNPLTLLVVRAQLSFEGLLADHHALELTAFYGGTRTNQVYPSSAPPTAENALTTLFQGEGGELGYRWYSGTSGPRGLYAGPSFLLAHYTAIPTRGAGTAAVMTGTQVPYWNLGGAIDVGWQAIFADRWVMNLGGGLMYTVPTHQFPAQELPASVYAIRGLRPRVLLGLGVAFD